MRRPTEAEAPPARSSAVFRVGLAILIPGTVMAAAIFSVVLREPAGERSLGISVYQFGTQDLPWMFVAVVGYVAAWQFARLRVAVPAPAARPLAVLAVAVLVAGIVRAGTTVIYHGFALSMDEYMMLWQSRLIMAGHLLAPAPDVWWPYSLALRPGFLISDPTLHVWAPPYRPGTAILHALLSFLSLGTAMNALFCAGSVIVLWRLARKTLPPGTGAAMCAILVFATSPQVLITGMTPYTMTAHLFVSLLWVWLFTTDRGWSHAAAIALGCYALGLHHVHVHGALALPFLLNLLVVQRRWRLSLAYGAAYAAAVAGWLFWMDLAAWVSDLSPVSTRQAAAVNGDMGLVRMAVSQGVKSHGLTDLVLLGVNFTRLVAWQNLAVLALVPVALSCFGAMHRTLRLLSWSVLTSLLPYLILMPSQGHGWGYRYLHHELGTLALLAGYGWAVLWARGRTRELRFVLALGVLSVVVALPLRSLQTEAMIRPFRDAMSVLQAQPADVVVIAAEELWYGRDLVRNDPLVRNRPVILALEQISDPDLERLCSARSVTYLDALAIRAASGLPLNGASGSDPAAGIATDKARLARAGCAT